MEKYKIDDVAKECGLTKRTIRYYEEIGLLSPPERSDGGIRLYTRDHMDRLKRIIMIRDVLGFSLQEIQELVSIREAFENQRQGIRQLTDESEKKQKLLEAEQTLGKQLEMVDQKLEKMVKFRNEVEQLHKRVQEAIQKIKE